MIWLNEHEMKLVELISGDALGLLQKSQVHFSYIRNVMAIL